MECKRWRGLILISLAVCPEPDADSDVNRSVTTFRGCGSVHGYPGPGDQEE
jgi:hypothetical protein